MMVAPAVANMAVDEEVNSNTLSAGEEEDAMQVMN